MNKNITKYEFDEKYVRKNTAVHCQTKESAEEFLRKADKFGYKWWSTDRYIDGNYDHKYEKDTCYNIFTGRYENIDYYRLNGFNIVEFDGFKESKDGGGSVFKVVVRLIDEEKEHILIMCEESIQISLRTLVDPKYQYVFFEDVDGAVFYTKKEVIKYVKTTVW